MRGIGIPYKYSTFQGKPIDFNSKIILPGTDFFINDYSYLYTPFTNLIYHFEISKRRIQNEKQLEMDR